MSVAQRSPTDAGASPEAGATLGGGPAGVAAGLSPGPDLFKGPRHELDADLRLHEAYREANKLFFDLLAASSASREVHFLARLRQASIYQFAEFLYLWKAYGLSDSDQLTRYVQIHNEQIAALMANKDRLRLLGFTRGRLGKALFDQASIQKLVVNFRHFDGSFDQSDLARLLIEVMSPETCRKTVLTLAEGGFLVRSTGVYNAILVRSTGTLEDAFARHVRHARCRAHNPRDDG